VPRYDGTGPRGQGPLTGRGMGFCIVQTSTNGLPGLKGFAGIQGKIISEKINNAKEVSKMPGGDGTGPLGMGAMTGRAAGFCAGYGTPGYMNPIPGRGFGMGRGRGFFGRGGGRGGGRGWAWGGMPYGAPYAMPYAAGAPYATPYATAPTKEQELEALKGQAEYFENAMGDIRKRLKELETEKAGK